MDYNLEVTNLTKKYLNSDFALKNISFAVPKGSIMGFVGENGAGKTTTISCILNMMKKDSGAVKIFDREMKDENIDIREDIGVVFDTVNFSGVLTPCKVGKVFAKVYKNWDNGIFAELTQKLNIPMHQPIREFSSGMSMKLSIAAALSHKPKMLILDEATSGMDPVVREEILDLFLDFVEDESHSILMSSHITSDLEKVADYITFIHCGETILVEKKDTLIYEYGVARLKAGQLELVDSSDYITYRARGYQMDVLVSDKKEFSKKYRNLLVDDVTIDEIMLLLVKGEK